MEGLTRTEPPPSRACRIDPVIYPLIVQFRVKLTYLLTYKVRNLDRPEAFRNKFDDLPGVKGLISAHNSAQHVPSSTLNGYDLPPTAYHTSQEAHKR